MVKEKEKTSPENLESQDEERQLILHNDDFNTFDFVIETLVEVCDHEPEQAEQSAYIVHFKGKCSVKKGSYKDLKPRYEAMKNKMLTVTID
ncbi:MAG: ATP-dependent Clp protease adaptor ClpS [Bacteroidales bacterium]|nr:ATP-dependent Clp protease adaptor ClpS [Bacteroidales bacterium]MCF8327111.1 ATP-dependent Clp protease adaptor ClpS [Bacteroidales bacterium]